MYQGLRAADFRAIFHLLGECRELWIDPHAWQSHLLAGLSELIHLPVGLVAEVAGFGPGEHPRVLYATEHGWSDAADQPVFHKQAPKATPFSSPLDLQFRQLVAQRGDFTATRADIFSDSDWRGREVFAIRFRRGRMEELLYSAVRVGPATGCYHLLVFGGLGHQPTEGERQCVEFLHRELVPLIGTSLASPAHICAHGLSPRRRQVLDLAKSGLSEKLIADRLGLRPTTVNEYFQKIRAHFGVRSRGELMAYLLARAPLSLPLSLH